MTSKKKLFLLGGVLFLIMSISGIYSLADEINKTESGLSTSAVDIELNEYSQNNEPFQEDGKKVMPGDKIILIPRINNLGIDCYLRAKITYSVEQESFNILDYIDGNYSTWTKKGDYYYYNSVLEEEDSVDLFQEVTIPNLSSDYQGKKVVIHIIVEAIQEKNFNGNWDEVDIKKSVERTYDIDYSGSSSVIYENDVNKYINLGNNFFDNLGNMLPGDTFKEEITIYNSSYDKNEYFLAIDYGKLTEQEISLLRNITIRIKNSKGEEIIFSNLANKEKHSLGIYSHNEGEKFTIELFLPVNVDNNYSKLFTNIIWRFSYETEYHRSSLINPKTWDLKYDLSITVFILSAIGFIVVLLIGRRDTDIIEKNKKRKRLN